MQLKSFRIRFTAGQLRRRNEKVHLRKENGHVCIFNEPIKQTNRERRLFRLSFRALRIRLLGR